MPLGRWDGNRVAVAIAQDSVQAAACTEQARPCSPNETSRLERAFSSRREGGTSVALAHGMRETTAACVSPWTFASLLGLCALACGPAGAENASQQASASGTAAVACTMVGAQATLPDGAQAFAVEGTATQWVSQNCPVGTRWTPRDVTCTFQAGAGDVTATIVAEPSNGQGEVYNQDIEPFVCTFYDKNGKVVGTENQPATPPPGEVEGAADLSCYADCDGGGDATVATANDVPPPTFQPDGSGLDTLPAGFCKEGLQAAFNANQADCVVASASKWKASLGVLPDGVPWMKSGDPRTITSSIENPDGQWPDYPTATKVVCGPFTYQAWTYDPDACLTACQQAYAGVDLVKACLKDPQSEFTYTVGAGVCAPPLPAQGSGNSAN
jgi:hypothetical protein